MARIVCLPGDGIGPEVMSVARQLLDIVASDTDVDVECETHAVGQSAIDSMGTALPDATLDAARTSDAVLLAAVGGGSTRENGPRPEDAVLGLRLALDTYANVRPAHALPSAARTSRGSGHADRMDLVIVREATSGTYFGRPKGRTGSNPRTAVDTCSYDEREIARVARVAFTMARERRGEVTSVDKANVMATSRLWREVVSEVSTAFPDVTLRHLLADAAAYELARAPERFDVIVTDNLFGDLLSDEAGALAGGLGLLGSATLGDAPPGLFEPVHGSAPDIAGQGIADPIGMARTVALLLRHGLRQAPVSRALDDAIDDVLLEGPRPRDVQPDSSATTEEVGDAIAVSFRRHLQD